MGPADASYCLIDSADLIAPAAAALGAEAEAVTWVTASERLASALRDRGIGRVVDLSSVPGEQELAELDALTAKATRTWYRHPDIAPVLDYGGIDLGEASELYWYLYLSWAFRMAQGERRCLSGFDADAVRLAAEAQPRTVWGVQPAEDEPVARKWASYRGMDPDKLRLPIPTQKPAAARPMDRVKRAARAAVLPLRSLVRTDLLRPAAPSSPRVLIASAPQHVASVLKNLGTERVEYLDESFRFAKWPLLIGARARYRSYPDLVRLIPPEGKARIAAFRARLKDASELLERAFYENDFFTYHGASMRPWLEDRRRFFFDRLLPRAAEMVEAFDAFFKKQGKMTVVVDEDTVLFRKLLVRTARRAGCPTLQIPHSIFFTDEHYDLFPVSSGRVVLGGAGIRDFYLKNGVDPDLMRLTGVPRYDRLAAITGPGNREAVRERLGLKPSDRIAFAALTTTHAADPRRKHREFTDSLRDLAALFAGLPDWKLVIKPHPLDFDFDLERELGGQAAPAGCRVLRNAGAMEWFVAADAVLSHPSNTVLESLAAERPTLILDYFPMSHCHVPVWHGLIRGLRVHDAAGLRKAWAGLLSEESLKIYREARTWLEQNWTGPLDGRSGERVAAAIRAESRS